MIVKLLVPLLVLNAGQIWTEKPKEAPVIASVPDFRQLVKSSIGAVVNVAVDQKITNHHGADNEEPQDQNDFLRRFFGQRVPRENHSHGLGSGFVISPDGYIVTNAHVVEASNGAKVAIKVKFPDDVSGDEFTAEVVGLDTRSDVALLKIKAKRTFPFLPLGNSSDMQVGDWVLAIGNPFGLSHSVSAGIVSALDRRGIFPDNRQGLYDYIQTDASINPGNSGGPLLNMRGEVIGINAAINPAGQGLGFAVPINMAKNVIGELHDKGRVARSWIGVQIQGMDAQLAKSFGLDRPQGALVAEVVASGPAAKAGLKKADVILEFNGKTVHDSSELPLLVSQENVGRSVPLQILRDGKKQTLKVALGEMPSDGGLQPASDNEPEKSGVGLQVQDVTPRLAERLELAEKTGVVVTHVEPGSPAEEAGMRNGDLVTELNGKGVTTAKSFIGAVRSTKSGEVLRLLVRRGEGSMFVALAKP